MKGHAQNPYPYGRTGRRRKIRGWMNLLAIIALTGVGIAGIYHDLWPWLLGYNADDTSPRASGLPGWWSYGFSWTSGGQRDAWDLFYHLGGNGPWIKKVDGVVDSPYNVPPQDCTVEQVHMMSRHGERYPTSAAGDRMLALIKRLKGSGESFKGSLEFLNDWEYFSQDPGQSHEQLVSTGPYAGTLEGFTTGVKIRTRYADLISKLPTDKQTRYWASDSQRVIDTARHFGAGFFGLDNTSSSSHPSNLEIIPETLGRGGDTLTPGDSCRKYRDDIERGHDYGAAMLAKFRSTYLPAIRTRLEHENPQLKKEPTLTDAEMYSMQELCGFEMLAKGESPWCDVFTREEWQSFEYARDIIHYYRAGPGNAYGVTMGWLWLNATTNILSSDPANSGRFFLSFVHDGDIIPMLAALDIMRDPEDPILPVTHVAKHRTWRTSQVVPMGGRITFERLRCKLPSKTHSNAEAGQQKDFVRININDGIVRLPACSKKDASTPDNSCPLNDFIDIIRKRGEDIPDFRSKCGLSEEYPSRITFLHQ